MTHVETEHTPGLWAGSVGRGLQVRVDTPLLGTFCCLLLATAFGGGDMLFLPVSSAVYMVRTSAFPGLDFSLLGRPGLSFQW